jgi:hypothetical protein
LYDEIILNIKKNVLPILPQGYKSLLLLVGGQVDGEHVGAPHWTGEHTTERVESMTSIKSDLRISPPPLSYAPSL